MNKGSDSFGTGLHLAGQAPLLIKPGDFDRFELTSNWERRCKFLSVDRCFGHAEDMSRHAQRKFLGGGRDRIPNHASFNLLPDLEILFRVQSAQMVNIDGTIEIAEELDIEAGRKGCSDQSGD